MKILVINCGSSSLKFRLVQTGKNYDTLANGLIDGLGQNPCKFTFGSKHKNMGINVKVKNHKEGISLALKTLRQSRTIKSYTEINAIAHRVVHGGEKYQKAIKIDANVIKEIKKLFALSPLHNPANLEGIMACKGILPKVPQVAVFDTSFYQTMPEKAFMYGLPYEWYKKYGIRKYGFHGSNHQYVMNETIKLLKKTSAKIITCHLGNGVSITASENGKAVDTSMGLTPLEGVMMGTRSGSIDPAIIFQMARLLKLKKFEKIEGILNNESGLKGLSQISNDMRKIYEKNLKKDRLANLTIEVLSYQVAKYCGAFAAVLNGVDAISFSGGMGEKAFYVREKVLSYLEFLGVKIDPQKNKTSEKIISSGKSKIKVFVIPANEERVLVAETEKALKRTK